MKSPKKRKSKLTQFKELSPKSQRQLLTKTGYVEIGGGRRITNVSKSGILRIKAGTQRRKKRPKEIITPREEAKAKLKSKLRSIGKDPAKYVFTTTGKKGKRELVARPEKKRQVEALREGKGVMFTRGKTRGHALKPREAVQLKPGEAPVLGRSWKRINNIWVPTEYAQHRAGRSLKQVGETITETTLPDEKGMKRLGPAEGMSAPEKFGRGVFDSIALSLPATAALPGFAAKAVGSVLLGTAKEDATRMVQNLKRAAAEEPAYTAGFAIPSVLGTAPSAAKGIKSISKSTGRTLKRSTKTSRGARGVRGGRGAVPLRLKPGKFHTTGKSVRLKGTTHYRIPSRQVKFTEKSGKPVHEPVKSFRRDTDAALDISALQPQQQSQRPAVGPAVGPEVGSEVGFKKVLKPRSEVSRRPGKMPLDIGGIQEFSIADFYAKVWGGAALGSSIISLARSDVGTRAPTQPGMDQVIRAPTATEEVQKQKILTGEKTAQIERNRLHTDVPTKIKTPVTPRTITQRPPRAAAEPASDFPSLKAPKIPSLFREHKNGKKKKRRGIELFAKEWRNPVASAEEVLRTEI